MNRRRKRGSTHPPTGSERIVPVGSGLWANAHTRLPKWVGKGFNTIGFCRHGLMIYNRYDIYIGRSLAAYREVTELEIELLCQILRRGQTVVDAGAS